MRDARGSARTMGSAAMAVAQEGETPDAHLVRSPAKVTEITRRDSASGGPAPSAFRNWRQICSRLRMFPRRAFFLDFDGTLVKLQRRPGEVRMSREAREVLARLAAHANTDVVIVSGRTRSNVRKLVALKTLRYFGVHGGEREGSSVVLNSRSREALAKALRAARREFAEVGDIWIQDKRLSFAVHYRGASAGEAHDAARALANLLEPWAQSLHLLGGSRVWEVLPREIPGKFTAVGDALGNRRSETGIVYIGNDGTDEVAFAALPEAVTVRVGREPQTHARYSLSGPAEVLRFLARLERHLS